LITTLIGLPLFLGSLWAGGVVWVIVVAVVTVVAAFEFTRFHAALSQSLRILSVAGAVGAAILIAWAPESLVSWVLALAGGVVLGAGVLRAFFNHVAASQAMAPSAWTTVALGIAYLGMPGGVLVRWRAQAPVQVLVWLIAIVWANDAAAFFVGSRFGRHKLAPRISPGKSWEGTIAGLFVAGILGGAFASAFGMSPAGGIIFGIVVSIASQAGDLYESTLKRTAGVKDSGSVLPGHGGVLDRFDGLLFAAPLGYVLMRAWTA